MARERAETQRTTTQRRATPATRAGRSSTLPDTRIIYCDDCLDQPARLAGGCFDLIYIDPPFNSNRNYEVFWGDSSEPRPSGSGPLTAFEDRHASAAAYIDTRRRRCFELSRVLKKTGSFYHHCDWRASPYVIVMLDQIPLRALDPCVHPPLQCGSRADRSRSER